MNKFKFITALVIAVIGLGLAVRTYSQNDQRQLVLEIRFDTTIQSNNVMTIPISIDDQTPTTGSLLEDPNFVAKAYELNKVSGEKSTVPIFNQSYFVKDRGETI